MGGQRHGLLKKLTPAAFENFLMTKYERLAGLTRTRSYPYVLVLDPSSICQLRCPTCYTGIVNDIRRRQGVRDIGRPAARLARGIAESIFEEIGDLLFYCHLYNWGEPLLNDDLPEIIRAASTRNIYTKVDTNLSLRLTDEKLEQLLLSGVSEISASIDGFSQQTYEQYRWGGRFELARENITRLAAMRNRLGLDATITWSFLVFSFNEHEAADVGEFCEQRDIEFNPRDPIVFDTQEAWLPKHLREGKPNPYREHLKARPAAEKPLTNAIPLYMGRPESRSCAWHYAYTTVNADGGVLPCCGLYKKRADFGEVDDAPGSFGRVWNNAHFEKARRIFPDTAAQATENPVAVCAQCQRSESFRDHYAVLDREIVRAYWSLPDGSDARRFDELYALLQRSPRAFAAAYAPRHAAAVSLAVDEARGVCERKLRAS